MELNDLMRAIEAILFAAGERVEIGRLAQTLEVDPKDIVQATDTLADQLAYDRRGIRILRLETGYQMVSSGEMADYITKALETRKPPKLSSSQLETLTIVAYYQPATKAMVEQIRGSGQLLFCGGPAEQEAHRGGRAAQRPGSPHPIQNHAGLFADLWPQLSGGAAPHRQDRLRRAH